MKKTISLFLLLTISLANFAQQPAIGEKPRLIVSIAIDGLRSDIISKLWNDFEQGGFKRLIQNGSYCKNMTFPYWNVGNVADYASVYTGTIPVDHGICSDTYFDRRTRRENLSLYDAEKKGIAGYTRVSPKNLVASTFPDELKLNSQGKSKIITIAINAQEAMVMAGHAGNSTVWIDDSTGTWTSSSYYGANLPAWAAKMNLINPAQEYAQRNWSNLYIGSQYKSMSAQSQASAFFAYPLSESVNKTNNYRKFKESPFANSLVRELAINAIKEEYIGLDENPDVVNLQFTVRGYNQSTTGVLTSEIEDMYLRLDKELRQIMDVLDFTCGTSNVLYMVYAPQTEYCNPEFLKSFNVPSGYFVADRSLSLLNSYLMANYGQGDFVERYNNRQIFLNKAEIQAKKLDETEFEKKVAEFMNRFQGVEFAFRAEDLQTVSSQNERIEAIKRAFDKNRCGDIMLYLLPGWVAVDNENEKVGLSTRVNNYAPCIFSGWKVKRQMITKPFSAIDIAPTLCNMLQISYPNANTGNALLDIEE